MLMLATTGARAQWSITPYVWTAAVDASVSFNGRTVIDEHIAFSDLMDDVEVATMLRIETQYGSFGGMLDLFYVAMATPGSDVQLPDGTPATIRSEVGMGVIDVTGRYSPHADGSGLAFVTGTRILAQWSDVELDVASSPGTTATSAASGSDVLFNALFGAMYRNRLAGPWSVDVRADIGTGEAELTWSAAGEVAYAFGARHRYAVSAGYRYLAIELAEDDPVRVDMAMSGLMTGFRIAF